MTIHNKTRRRQGGKVLFKTVTNTLNSKDATAKDWEVFVEQSKKNHSIDWQISQIESTASEILRQHNIPTEFPGFLTCLDQKFDLSPDASYAVDLMFRCYTLRDALKREQLHDSESVREAYKLGACLTMAKAESVRLRREQDKTKKAGKGKQELVEKRQKHIRELAIELFDWKDSAILSRPERSKLKGALLARYPEYRNDGKHSISDDTLARDAKILGMM